MKGTRLRDPSEEPDGHQRARWWISTRPTQDEFLKWQIQLTVDIVRKWGTTEEEDEIGELCYAPAMVLPAEAFETAAAHKPVQAYEQDVPRTWLWSGGDAWTVAFASRLAGHGQPEVADDLRESLRSGVLPSKIEQTVLNRVLAELTLREWVDIAICEKWTVTRAAEVARNAGCWNHEICNWMNAHADPGRLPVPSTPPGPESALETHDRCFRQPLIHG